MMCTAHWILLGWTNRKGWGGGHVARLGGRWNAYRVLMGEPEGDEQLGRPRNRWERNIKMDFK